MRTSQEAHEQESEVIVRVHLAENTDDLNSVNERSALLAS